MALCLEEKAAAHEPVEDTLSAFSKSRSTDQPSPGHHSHTGGKALFALGFTASPKREARVFYRHPDSRTTTIPHHPGHDLARPLLRDILREIELSPEEFVQVLCKTWAGWSSALERIGFAQAIRTVGRDDRGIHVAVRRHLAPRRRPEQDHSKRRHRLDDTLKNLIQLFLVASHRSFLRDYPHVGWGFCHRDYFKLLIWKIVSEKKLFLHKIILIQKNN